MKLFLMHQRGPRIPIREDGVLGVLAGPCPQCGTDPCYVVGQDRRISRDDRAYEATAFCTECVERGPVGVIRAETGTLFGVAEDERVLGSGLKVF